MAHLSCYSCKTTLINPANIRFNDETESFCWICWRHYLMQLAIISLFPERDDYTPLEDLHNIYDLVLGLAIEEKLECLKGFYKIRFNLIRKWRSQ